VRSGAWLCANTFLLLAAALGACSGGYTLEPTPCDDWCHATQGGYAYCGGYYDPANCVSQCEEDGSGRPECRTQLDAVTACFRNDPQALSAQCDYNFDPVTLMEHCKPEAAALVNCASQYWQGGGAISDVPQPPARD
jgi:hypothetical protein